MKSNATNIMWGILLILVGGVFLAINFGYLEFITPQFWTYIFIGISLMFFAGYFISGVRQWGLLFPACIFGAGAITMALTNAGFSSSYIGSPILAAIGLPFLVAYFLDRKNNWWALIPAWVMFVLTLITALADFAPGELIGSIFLFAIGLPFLVVYFANRKNWWALIPGLILTAIAFVPLLSTQAKGEFIAALVMGGISLAFLAVYLNKRTEWWALIPFGIMASIGISLLFIGAEVFNGRLEGLYGGIMMLGFAATFGVLWLMRGTNPTEWAKYPAIVIAGIAVLTTFFSIGFQIIWPFLIIAGGILLLYVGLRKKPSLKSE